MTPNDVFVGHRQDTKKANPVKIKITEKAVKALRPPASGNRIYYDDEVRCFGVRITANGAISFILNYTVGGRRRRYTMANYPDKGVVWARAEAIRLRGTTRDGQD